MPPTTGHVRLHRLSPESQASGKRIGIQNLKLLRHLHLIQISLLDHRCSLRILPCKLINYLLINQVFFDIIMVSDNEMAPREVELPGTWLTAARGGSEDGNRLASRAPYVLNRVRPDGTEELASEHPRLRERLAGRDVRRDRRGREERPQPLRVRPAHSALRACSPGATIRAGPGNDDDERVIAGDTRAGARNLLRPGRGAPCYLR